MSNPSLGEFEEAIVSASLNGQLLSNLLFGMFIPDRRTYSAVYFYTLYISTRKTSRSHWIVIGGITLSYIAYLLQTVIGWAFLKIALVEHGDTRLDAFLESFAAHGPRGAFLLEVTLFVMAGIADALMIWRCYFIWSRSVRVILLPSFLLFTEVVLDLTIIGTLAKADFSQTHVAHNLLGGAIFVTFLTTLVASLLIAYRINSLAKGNLSHDSRTLVKRVLDILIQSAAAYCVVTLAAAISVILATPVADTFDSHTAVLYGNQEYVTIIWAFTAATAPTIMVARIVQGPANDLTTAEVSGMQFNMQTFTAQSATRMGTEGVLENGSGHSLEAKEFA